jgi:hypothetical protein
MRRLQLLSISLVLLLVTFLMPSPSTAYPLVWCSQICPVSGGLGPVSCIDDCTGKVVGCRQSCLYGPSPLPW